MDRECKGEEKLQGGFGGKVGSGVVVGKGTIFMCPKYDVEHASSNASQIMCPMNKKGKGHPIYI